MALPIPGASIIENADRERNYLAQPENLVGKVDPEIHKAWKQHMIAGFNQNQEMFDKILHAFLVPYWSTVWMYRILFTVGILSFLAAIVLGVWKGVLYTAIFGGLSAATFIGYFLNLPTRAMEQNILFITWLGMIYNSYWTRLMYANDNSNIQKDLDKITQTSLAQMNELVNKQNRISNQRFISAKDFEQNSKEDADSSTT